MNSHSKSQRIAFIALLVAAVVLIAGGAFGVVNRTSASGEQMLSDMRLNLPTELKQAKNLLNDRKNILYIARKEAEDTVKLAEERAKKILDQDELVRQAQARANEIVTQAQMQAREIKKATNEFVEQRLTEVESNLVKNLNEVRDTKKALRPGKAAN